MQARFDDWTLDHQGDLVDRRVLDAQIERILTERIVATEHDPPSDLVDAIGHPPIGIDARSEWRAAAVDLAIEARRNDRDIDVGDDVDTPPINRHEAMELT